MSRLLVACLVDWVLTLHMVAAVEIVCWLEPALKEHFPPRWEEDERGTPAIDKAIATLSGKGPA